jgi:lysozyme family protein
VYSKPLFSKLKLVPRRVEVVKEKVHSILSKTPGYEQICETEEIFSY